MMKRLIVILLLLMGMSAFAEAQKIDTTYVIDSKPTLKKLNDIDPNQICTVSILKSAAGSVQYDPSVVTIIVTTKRFAILQYQHNLEAFSSDYKNSLDSVKQDDSKFSYVLDGQSFKTENDRIKALYDIPQSQIKSVHFMGKFYKGVVNNQQEVVLVQTK